MHILSLVICGTTAEKRKGEEAPAPSQQVKDSLTISFSIITGPPEVPHWQITRSVLYSARNLYAAHRRQITRRF